MVEAAGIEPTPSCISGVYNIGQTEENAGQETAQPGQGQDVTKEVTVDEGTEPDTCQSHVGRSKNTKGTQQEHKEDGLPYDLKLVADHWHSLPEAVKAGIVAMVMVAKGNS